MKMKMKKILIIGCPGGGKSSFARELHKRTSLPLCHLDMLFWNADKTTVTRELLCERVRDVLSGDEWIIDGNFNRTIPLRLQYSDTVIWLDFPRLTCILGVLKRVITNYGKTRPDMGDGCPERFDFEFLRFVWGFNKKHRQRYNEMLDNTNGIRVIKLKNRKEVARFLENI